MDENDEIRTVELKPSLSGDGESKFKKVLKAIFIKDFLFKAGALVLSALIWILSVGLS